MAILLLFIFLLLALQSSVVQTRLVTYVSTFLQKKTGHEVTVEKVDINWFDEIELKKLKLQDPQDTTLIAIDRLLVDFSAIDLLRSGDLHFDAARITGADVRIVKFADGQLDNMSWFIKQIRPESSGTGALPKPVSIGRIKLENSRFSLNDMRKDSIVNGFNYNQFIIDDINTDLSDFYQRLDTIRFSIDKLIGRDRAGKLAIKSLKTNFLLTSEMMEFANLDLNTGNSHLANYVKFEFSDPSNMSYFIDSVYTEARFDSTVISNEDLRHFATTLEAYNDVYTLSGDYTGGVTRFTLKDFTLRFGKGSVLSGTSTFTGLPNFAETFIDLRLTDSRLLATDVNTYLEEDASAILNRLGFISFDGRFVGFTNDFVANGNFLSQLGTVKSDLNLKLPGDPAEASYRGALTVNNLDVGRLLNNPEQFQRLSFNGSIEGSGLTMRSADFYVKGNIQKLGYNGYEYQKIRTDARMAQSFFEGEVSIADPNVKLELDGSLDFRNNINRFQIDASLDTLFLQPLRLSENDVFISGDVNLDLEGLKLDSIVGYASVYDLNLILDGKFFEADSIVAYSVRKGEHRTFELVTDDVLLKAEGDFEFTRLYHDVKTTLAEYELAFRNDKEEIDEYYASKQPEQLNPYTINIEATLVDINPLVSLFVNDFYLAKGTSLEGQYSKNLTSVASLYTTFDTLRLGNFTFLNNELEFNTSKVSDSTDVLAMLFISNQQQLAGNTVNTHQNYLEAIWGSNNIDFQINIEQPNTTNSARVFGDLQFQPDRTVITMQPSDLQVLEGRWEFAKGNQVVITEEAIAFEGFRLSAGNQEIELTGYISDSTNIPLRARITNFSLNNLSPLLPVPLNGIVTGHLTLANYGEGAIVESDLKVDDFKVDQFLVGNVSGRSNWNDRSKRIQSLLTVYREGKNIITIDGHYAPRDSVNQMNFNANFDDASLNVIEPFIRNNFTEIRGTASGRFKVTGSLNYPILRGTGTISDGAGRINYLNTFYTFNGDIFFDDNEIGVRNLDVRDIQNHRATLNGGIFHDGFRNFVLDLEGRLNNFQVLNTSSRDNSLYYGTAFATGSVNFLGAISNLNISARASTNRNTRIFIPLEDDATTDVEDFISFVNFSDTTRTEASSTEPDAVNVSNIRLDFDLEVTPDAYCELIFDIKAGDIIRGRGNGRLNLQIDTNGDFYMFGDLEIEEGGYNFTLYNIINKEFDIESGSTISWAGDPYRGIMDIKANYRQNALITPILLNIDTTAANTPELRRRYPTNVVLDLDGELLTPQISFEIEIAGYPEQVTLPSGQPIMLSAEVQRFNNQIKTDEQELKRQVFSLIILRRFSPLNSFNVGTTSIGSSVSEFVSNQLSYWISQVDENLEIDVDLSGLDNDAYNTFQLRLAYTFLDGRLRVSRDGGITSTTTSADLGAIMGDWTVEYLLTPDGKLRAKMYSRTSYNSLNQGLDNQTNTKTGFSLQYIRSFNNFRDLMSDVRSKNRAPEEPKEEPTSSKFDLFIREEEVDPASKTAS